MGEYAKYNGESIKIGTCEDMYYLRADQAFQVEPEDNSVNPRDPKDARELRFRFPFPDEDGIEPGGFEPVERGVGITVKWPDGHEPECAKDCSDRSRISIEQQRLVGDELVLVVRCLACDERYRLPTLADAFPVIEACRWKIEGTARPFYRQIAARIAGGYLDPTPWSGKVSAPRLAVRRKS